MCSFNNTQRELEGFGIRLNKSPPDIVFNKKDKGGINFSASAKQSELTEELCRTICHEYRINSADIRVNYPDATSDDLIDVIEGNRFAFLTLFE